MPVEFEPPRRGNPSIRARREEFAQWMLLADAAFDSEIRRRAVQNPVAFYAELGDWIKVPTQPQKGWHAVHASNAAVFGKIFNVSPRDQIDFLTKSLGATRSDFCAVSRYCEDKAQIQEALARVAAAASTTKLAPAAALRKLGETAPEVLEIADAMMGTLPGDPVWLLAKLARHGLDQLCAC